MNMPALVGQLILGAALFWHRCPNLLGAHTVLKVLGTALFLLALVQTPLFYSWFSL